MSHDEFWNIKINIIEPEETLKKLLVDQKKVIARNTGWEFIVDALSMANI
ncbi:MAG: hypothetical protein O4806_00025 [Trichodesmium sp. St5_bin8]|nr:hypothetical protein [Trichodesmium sp. St5_bin8]